MADSHTIYVDGVGLILCERSIRAKRVIGSISAISASAQFSAVVQPIISIERIDYIKNSINAVRNELPDGAVEAEKKSESHGRQPALVS